MWNLAIMKHSASLINILMALLISGILPAAETGNDIRANGARLNATMDHMKTFGMSDTGGSTRVAYTDANRVALSYLSSLMLQSGLIPRIDVAGNLVGRREGKAGELAPIVSGSHIDTVPNGGHYDGIVGVMGVVPAVAAPTASLAIIKVRTFRATPNAIVIIEIRLIDMTTTFLRFQTSARRPSGMVTNSRSVTKAVPPNRPSCVSDKSKSSLMPSKATPINPRSALSINATKERTPKVHHAPLTGLEGVVLFNFD